ncbi:hypothetical protein ACTXT7_012734 [Hymenolepis weldensis]
MVSSSLWQRKEVDKVAQLLNNESIHYPTSETDVDAGSGVDGESTGNRFQTCTSNASGCYSVEVHKSAFDNHDSRFRYKVLCNRKYN